MRAARLPLLPALAAGLKLRGELDTLAPWAFVDRFCFVPTPEADADLAEETAAYARESILQQASVAVLSQAMRAPELALQLLRP